MVGPSTPRMGHEMPFVETVSWTSSVVIEIPYSMYLSVRQYLLLVLASYPACSVTADKGKQASTPRKDKLAWLQQ